MLAAAWLAASTPARAQEQIAIAVPLGPGAAPYLAAIENGFFREVGIDAEIFYASGAVTASFLDSGQMQYSASPFPAIDAALKGADIKVVFVSRSHAHYVLWSFDPAIRTLADAVRYPISLTTRGGTQEVALRVALDAVGVARDGLSLKATPFERERLASIRNNGEKLAVLIAGEDGGGGGRMLADLSREAQLATEGLATTGAELATHRDRAKRVLYAVHRGADWVMENRDAATASLRRQMPDDSAYDWAQEIAAGIRERNEDGTIARDKIAREIKVRAEMLGVSAPSLDKIYDFSLIAEIKSEGRW